MLSITSVMVSFPPVDRILMCATRLQQAIDLADQFRLIPKLYWCDRWERDSSGHTQYTLSDYRGVPVGVSEPSLASPHRTLRANVAHVIAPLDLLDRANSFPSSGP